MLLSSNGRLRSAKQRSTRVRGQVCFLPPPSTAQRVNQHHQGRASKTLDALQRLLFQGSDVVSFKRRFETFIHTKAHVASSCHHQPVSAAQISPSLLQKAWKNEQCGELIYQRKYWAKASSASLAHGLPSFDSQLQLTIRLTNLKPLRPSISIPIMHDSHPHTCYLHTSRRNHGSAWLVMDSLWVSTQHTSMARQLDVRAGISMKAAANRCNAVTMGLWIKKTERQSVTPLRAFDAVIWNHKLVVGKGKLLEATWWVCMRYIKSIRQPIQWVSPWKHSIYQIQLLIRLASKLAQPVSSSRVLYLPSLVKLPSILHPAMLWLQVFFQKVYDIIIGQFVQDSDILRANKTVLCVCLFAQKN